MSFYKLNAGFFNLAFGGGTPLKAFLTACVVGTILTGINHGDEIIIGDYPNPMKVILTYCVPYIVTTWGAITGKLQKIIDDVQKFFNQNKIIDLSFFNFENAITAAYYADKNLNVLKVNKNFKIFFPFLGNVNNSNFLEVLKSLGISKEQIEEFDLSINEKGKVFIPRVEISINGKIRIFSLLSTKTNSKSFGYLNGFQGQFVDITDY